MSPDDGIPDDVLDVLAHAFAGDATAAVVVEAWAATHPARRAKIEQARALWDAAAPPDEAEDARATDAAWHAFQARVAGRKGDDA